MISLYVVRHGETHNNAAGILMSMLEARMNDKGRGQMREAGQKISEDAGGQVDTIVHSPMQHARESAEIIRSVVGGCELVEEKALLDFALCECEGKPREYAFKKFPRFRRDPNFRFPEGSETHAELRKRVLDFVYSLEASRPSHSVVLVTHSEPMAAIIGEFGKHDWLEIARGNVPRGPYKIVLEKRELKELKEL